MQLILLMTFGTEHLLHFCGVVVATLGQISPEMATVFQLLQYSFAAFCGWVLLTIRMRIPKANNFKRATFRKRQVLAHHACRYRPLGWQRFYRSAWPLRLRLQHDGCVYCALWLRTTTGTSHFQRVIRWQSDGLGYLFDRTRGHPGEGPEDENVRVDVMWMWCVCVFVFVCLCVTSV
jgi:hypothetical protein